MTKYSKVTQMPNDPASKTHPLPTKGAIQRVSYTVQLKRDFRNRMRLVELNFTTEGASLVVLPEM